MLSFKHPNRQRPVFLARRACRMLSSRIEPLESRVHLSTTAIMVNQFTRLRDGDRFFYLNENLNSEEISILNQGNTLAKVIEANTNITNLQSNVFLFKASISGTVSTASNMPGGRSGQMGLAGLMVELEDASGDVLATALTNSQGQYLFNQLSGPAANPTIPSGVSGTGTYKVVLVLPSEATQLSPAPAAITITSGDTNVANVNFNVELAS